MCAATACPPILLLTADSQPELLAKLEREPLHSDRDHLRCRFRLAIVAPNPKRLALARRAVEKGRPWRGKDQIYFSGAGFLRSEGKLAFVFPGVDNYFEPRIVDVAEHFAIDLPEGMEAGDPADDLLRIGLAIAQTNRLFNRVLQYELNIRPDCIAGHSLGEWSGLYASKIWSDEQFASMVRATVPGSMSVPDALFLACGCDAETALSALRGLTDIAISHDNCPHQTVLCGRPEAIKIAQERLHELRVLAQPLSFISGFHSPLFADHLSSHRANFASYRFDEPEVKMWSATTCDYYPVGADAKRELSIEHLLKPVRFRQLTEKMYAAGVRVFLQAGPGTLTGFIEDTLSGRPHLAISVNIAKRSGLEQLANVCAALWVEGLQPNFARLNTPSAPMPSPEYATASIAGAALPRNSGDVPPAQRNTAFTADIESVTAADIAASNPHEAAFLQVLQDIHSAGMEVLQAHHQYRESLANVFDRAASSWPKTLHKLLDAERGTFRDHCLYPQQEGWPIPEDWRPVVPLTGEILLIRDWLEELLPGRRVISVENVQAFNWLVIARSVELKITVMPCGADRFSVLIDNYVTAVARVAEQLPEPPAAQKKLEKTNDIVIAGAQIYTEKVMFHGPAYRGIAAFGPYNDQGAYGRLCCPTGLGGLLDSMAQLGGVWLDATQPDNNLALPIALKAIRFYADDPAPDTSCDATVWVRTLSADTLIIDMELRSAEGEVLAVIEGWETRRFHMDKAFWKASLRLDKNIFSATLAPGLAAFRDTYDKSNTRSYLAGRMLNQLEMSAYEKIPPRQKRQWLNGRVAAKDAVRHWLWQRHGPIPIFPKELTIANDAHGAPTVQPHITRCFREHLRISIAHKDLLAVAMVADTVSVGIDIERIETRGQAFIDVAFTEADQRWLDADRLDESVTRLWAAKEAVGKAQGLGLRFDPHTLRVESVAGARVCVDGRWVDSCCIDNYLICWTE